MSKRVILILVLSGLILAGVWAFSQRNPFLYAVKKGFASQILWKAISYPQGDYSNSSLVGIKILHSNLSNSNFSNSNLSKSNMDDIELRGSNFSNSNLSGSNIRYARLQNTNFKNANLPTIVLYTVFLNGADLQGASLQNANLVYARLYSANFEGCNLQGVKFTESYYDIHTKWPKNFQPQKHGATLTVKGSDKSRRDDIDLSSK